MKAKVLYVSKSGNSIIISITQPIAGTKLMNKITGFISCEHDAYKVDDEFELPAMKVTKKVTKSVATEEFPEVREFEQLEFTNN